MSNSSSSSSQPLLSDRDYEQDRRDGALDKPIARVAYMVILLVVSFAVFTIAGLATRYGLYNQTSSVTLGAGDSWSVCVQKSGAFNGVFCSEYSVQATRPQAQTSQETDRSQSGGIFSIIALSAEARLASSITPRNIHETGTLGAYALSKYFIYHVSQPMGDVQISTCSNQTDVSVINCKDENDARRFISNGPNSGACSYGKACYFTKCGGPQMDCSYRAMQIDSRTMEAVILVVYRTSGHDTGGESVEVDFNILSSTYKLDKKVASCDSASGACTLPVPMAASDIILQIPDDTKMNPTHLEGNCISRVPIYICIFVGLPLALMLVFGGCALCLIKTQANITRVTEQADRTREYKSLGRRQNELERSNFLRPMQEQPPPPSYPEDGNIQVPASTDSVADCSVAV